MALHFVKSALGGGKVRLRDLFWLLLLSAIAIGWGVKRTRLAKKLAKEEQKNPLLAGLLTTRNKPTPEAVARAQILAELHSLTNQQLTARLSKLLVPRWGSADAQYSACLSEMARRGMQVELQAHYDKVLASPGDDHWGPANSAALTALRRAQGQPDPVKIHVELSHADEEGKPHTRPELVANLENVDVERQPVYLTRGGDYRSGRLTRWRVHLTGSDGRRVADSNFFDMIGGGMASLGPLAPGEQIEYPHRLDARKYVRPAPTGRYQLQVLYAEHEIASEPDLAGMIVWRSDPIAVDVENHYRPVRQISIWPLIALMAIGTSAMLALELRNRVRAGHAGQLHRRKFLSRRDGLALALLTTLVAVWQIDIKRLQDQIDNVRPHAEAEWTMGVAKN